MGVLTVATAWMPSLASPTTAMQTERTKQTEQSLTAGAVQREPQRYARINVWPIRVRGSPLLLVTS
jgi:hypothetical protein